MMKASDQTQEIGLQGIGVSPGVVMGPAFVMAPQAQYVPERTISADDVDSELARLENALIETRRQIQIIQKDLERRQVMVDSGILDAHLMVLDDHAFMEEIVQAISTQHRNAESVVREASDRYTEVLASMEDEYLKERGADVRDVTRRLIRNLLGKDGTALADMTRQHIIVAQDIAPSETALFRREKVLGFVTDYGSLTSHTALMARALEIPAIVGLGNISRRVATGDKILIDGNKGVLIINPSEESLEQYDRVAEERRNIESGLRRSLQEKSAETTDGHDITLSANIEDVDELDAVLDYGAEGIGLFRSEYLYMARDRQVDEDSQTEVYTRLAKAVYPAPVIIRTLDLGGDKFAEDLPVHKESNPFLGCRSIRLSLQHPETFKTQLRAILRASAGGNVKLMYPMISSVGEVHQANALLEVAKTELKSENIEFQSDIDVGVMIEIPSAALTADVIAEHVSFFSLGTNDLTQYTLAVDRINERVAYLYKPAHPAVLKLIRQTVHSGHRRGLWVGLCGEMAANPLMTHLLVGLGVDELSVAPSAIPLVKDAVCSVSFSRAQELAELSLTCKTSDEVLEHCRKLTSEVSPELLELI